MPKPEKRIGCWLYTGLGFICVGAFLGVLLVFLSIMYPTTLSPDQSWCSQMNYPTTPGVNFLPAGVFFCAVIGLVSLVWYAQSVNPAYYGNGAEQRDKCVHGTVCKLNSCPSDCDEYFYMPKG